MTPVEIALAAGALLSAIGGPLLSVYVARQRGGLDKAMEKKIIAEVSAINSDRDIEHIAGLQAQITAIQKVADERWRRQRALEQYVDRDIPWHREAVEKLRECGVVMTTPAPTLPTHEDD